MTGTEDRRISRCVCTRLTVAVPESIPSSSTRDQGGRAVGKSVLASHFVAGLLGNIKMKLAGSDGDFD